MAYAARICGLFGIFALLLAAGCRQGGTSAAEKKKFDDYVAAQMPKDRAEIERAMAAMPPDVRERLIRQVAAHPPADEDSAKRRRQSVREVENLRLLDAAIDQYAIDTQRPAGFVVTFDDLRHYLKADTLLYNTGENSIGRKYETFTVGSALKVESQIYNAFSDVTDAAFWSPYR